MTCAERIQTPPGKKLGTPVWYPQTTPLSGLIYTYSGRAVLDEGSMILAEDKVQKPSAPGQVCHWAQLKGLQRYTYCHSGGLDQSVWRDTMYMVALVPLGTAFPHCMTNLRAVSDYTLVCVGISACLTYDTHQSHGQASWSHHLRALNHM